MIFKKRKRGIGMIEHDGCDGCMYVNKDETEEPCVSCKNAYVDMYRQKEVSLSDKLEQIADHYGTSKQLNKLIEELADLSVVFDQVIYLSGSEEKLDEIRRYKVGRQLKRIEEETE